MTARRSLEVTCPNCGTAFRLEDSLVERLEQQWSDRVRADVRRELAPEIDKKAEAKAEKLAGTKLRNKDEEVKEAQKQIASLRRQVTTLQHKLPSGRAQQLGIVRQDTLADLLRVRFPTDEITVVAQGRAGADVSQIVRGGASGVSGKILWESKRAAAWSKGWIAKLMSDAKRGGYTAGVIVSDVLPDDDRLFMQVGDVWACKLEVAPEVAYMIRQGIIGIALARGVAAKRDDVKGEVYDYITGSEFASILTAIVTTAMSMRDDIESERRTAAVRLRKREQQINSMVEDLAGVYGRLQGIGASLPEVAVLEIEPVVERLPNGQTLTVRRGRDLDDDA